MLIGYLVVGLCAFLQLGVQAKLSVTFDDVEIEALDPEYFDTEVTYVYVDEDEEGEGTINTRYKIIKSLPESTDGHFTLFGLSMGEYTMPTGVDVDMSLCEMIDEPILVGPFFRANGFSPDECPVLPGLYQVKGYHLPLDKLPDEFDENKYQGRFEISVDGKLVIAVKVIADVQSAFEP